MPIKDEQHDKAFNTLREEYFESIRGWAESIKKELADGVYEDREDLLDRMHEAVDGNYWVIYTHANKQVLFVSPNPDAYVDQFGEEGLVKNGNVNWAAMAFCAVEQDLVEMLGDIGVDVNDPFPEADEDDEEADAEATGGAS